MRYLYESTQLPWIDAFEFPSKFPDDLAQLQVGPLHSKIIPETQVATNQGVQTRDVMSFLSGVMCYSD